MRKKQPRYPIYIPSKGRAYRPLTIKRLQEMGIDFYVVVEPPDAESYNPLVKPHQLLVLPFADLGQGSIPARNWIWDHAISLGVERHWVIDDNHQRFFRLNYLTKIPMSSSAGFRAAEDFVDRYSNVALAGFHDRGFVDPANQSLGPYRLNTRVYSVTLLLNSLPYRWRGRYNEDTDLCLQALKDGWVTVNFTCFLGNKVATMTMRGGNTDAVYNTGDHRLEFAESLRRQHPDCVKVTWKFGRWHHEVDYSAFRDNQLKRRAGLVPMAGCNEYGMVLRRAEVSE